MFRFGFRNGNAYSAGYTKGNFAFVGVTEEGFPDVNPVPSATLWGETTSDAQVRTAPPKSLDALPPADPAPSTPLVPLSQPSPASIDRTSTLRR